MVRDSFNELRTPVTNIISRIFCVIFMIITTVFLVRMAFLNVLPTKYYLIILLVLIILNLIFFHVSFRRRTAKVTSVIFSLFSVLLSAGLILTQFKIGEIENFIKKNFDDKKTYAIYNVIVSKKSNVSVFKDLEGTEIFTYEEPVKEISNDDLKKEVKNVISDSTLVFKDDLDTVMNRVLKMTDTASIVNNGTYESYLGVHEGYEEQIKIIGEIKIEVTGKVDEKTDAVKSTIANTPFILLISGIDTRTGTMPSRSLSDVNIVAAVNPNTKKILLVSIPRDTYVQIHGTTGLLDKLTHAGSLGGIDLTKSTIEDFLNIKADRYIRVNFNFVTNLVDSIGGISVNNDQPRTLILDGCTYVPGENNVNGKCALRFARERKSYETGDRHRGENQEQVISRILEKISKDKNIINDYSKILNALDGSFDTNISSEDITALVRMQLNDMSGWSIESYNINGIGQNTRTYSYPNQDLYVMMPDLNTVTTAKEKISALML